MAKVGRPTKYRSDMCETVVEMMREGCGKVEVCAALDICYDTWRMWQDENAEFSEAVSRGERLSEAWWQKMGRENVTTKEFNTPLWKSNMANRFRWADRSDQRVEVEDVTDRTPAEMLARAASLIAAATASGAGKPTGGDGEA